MTRQPTALRDQMPRITDRLECLIRHCGNHLLGKEERIRLALTALLARGHLLIEDVPGVGKTTLAHGLARAVGLDFRRIQFTSDLLPADITGVSIFDTREQGFRFHPGPLFSNVVLADEINRATPKSQSALLEAMEEGQVSVDGTSHRLPEPFFVIATQNPLEQLGTHPLPESQLDRFALRIDLGYPDPAAERAMLRGKAINPEHEGQHPCLAAGELATLQALTRQVHLSDELLDHVQALLAYTREAEDIPVGLSPRAGRSLVGLGQAWPCSTAATSSPRKTSSP